MFLILSSLLVAVAFSMSDMSWMMAGGIWITSNIAYHAISFFQQRAARRRDPSLFSTSAKKRLQDEDFAHAQAAVIEVLFAAPHPTLLVDSEGRVLARSQVGKRLFGSAKRGVRLAAIIRHSELLETFETVLSTQKGDTLDLIDPLHVDAPWEAELRPVNLEHWDEKPVKAMLIIFRDMSEAKAIEKAKVDFVANASHELRTPLASITGFLETLKGHAKDDEASRIKFINMMQKQAKRMQLLIEDLMSLSRIETAEHIRPRDLVDLSQVYMDVADTLAHLKMDKDVTINRPEIGPLPVKGDKDNLHQIIQNILENAIKYSHDGGQIDVSFVTDLTVGKAESYCQKTWPEAQRVSIVQLPNTYKKFTAIRIRDHGPGIAREHLPRLSERFYRVSAARDREVGGTGLGLAIVKHIILRHRGGFVAESIEGEGTSFVLFIPQPKTSGEAVDRST